MTDPLFDLTPTVDAETLRLRANIARLLANIGQPAFCSDKGGHGCGQEIWWVTTRQGKKAPINADGSSHFGTCAVRGKKDSV